jgi:membrane protein insertase Oxa1/YidC/SpoIIIJ
MDEDYGGGTKDPVETEAYKERERRRQEIKQEMQKLAAENKGHPS